MSEVVGNISVVATINTKGYDAGKQKIEAGNKELEKSAKNTSDAVENGLKKTSSNSIKASDALSGLTGKMVGLAAAATATIGVANLLGSSFSDLAGLQTARSGFEVLTGSAEKASQVMQEIGKYANTTPFEFPEIAGAAKTLLGFGVDAKDVQGNIQNLGNAVAASGGDFSNVSRVFGQIFAAGKVNAEDFNQLIDNGIALGPEISKQLGIPMSDLKDNLAAGKVTFDVFNKALQSASSEGGKYFGATAKLSETLNGRISTLKDTFTGFVGQIIGVDFGTGIVQAGGAFANLSDGIKLTTDFLSTTGLTAFNNFKISVTNLWTEIVKIATSVGNYLIPKFQSLWSELNVNIIPTLTSLWKDVLVPLAPVIGTTLVVAVGFLVDAFTILLDWASKLWQGFKDGNPIIIGLATTFGILAAAMAFNAIFNALSVGFATLTLVTIPSAIASVGALSALIASPIVMPAIAIGAALASIAAVWAAYNEMKSAIDGLKSAQQNLTTTSLANYKAQSAIVNDYTSSPERKAAARAAMSRLESQRIPGLASGGSVSAGQPYFVGDNPDGSLNNTTELFVPRSSGTIVSSGELQGMLGGSSTSNTFNINLSGIMASSPSDERAIAKRLAERINEELRSKGKQGLAI